MTFDVKSWLSNKTSAPAPQGRGTSVQPQQPARPSRKQEEEPPPAAPPWDYKTSPVNQKGESLPAGAKSWTPMGTPYFGPGLSGTLKKYAYGLMGSPAQGAEADRWARFNELTSNAPSVYSPAGRTKEAGKKSAEATGLFFQGLVGSTRTDETAQTDWAEVARAKARLKQIGDQYAVQQGHIANLPEGVRKEYTELQTTIAGGIASTAEGRTSFEVGGQNVSLLTPLLRGSKVGVQMLMDALSEASVKMEQAQGAQQAVREFANEKSGLPQLSFDVNREADIYAKEERVAVAQDIANIASRLLLPVLSGWDALRFWTAPGTLAEKQKVIGEGWDAGRVLYSQAIKPSLLEEFKRRAASGEDPQLLAMELQNPWAEAVGQAVLDPLNFIGMVSKGAKIAGMLDDATDAVRGGSLGDEAAELLKDAGKAMPGPLGETRAAERFQKFDDLLTTNVQRIENARLTPDYNKLTAYSPSGMRVRETKVVQTTAQIVTSSIMRSGGSADEVADFFHYLSKATSTDKAIRMEAWDSIMTLSQRYGLGRYPFSDDVLETGILLRNLTEDKELLTVLKAGKGDLAETAKILDRTFQRAVEKQIPTYTETKKAAEALRTGGETTKQTKRLAAMYEGVKNKAAWNLHEGKVGDFKQAVNSFLGKFFFAQPGFVSRNASNNLMTMFVDQGLSGTAKSFYRDGRYWSIADIEDDLMKYFGGKLPPATSGITLSKAEKAETAVSKLNDAVESGFAKRIYWKQFRDTMDKFMTPGVALPARAEFKAAGMTNEAIDHFVHVLKNEAHGNVEQAILKYAEKFGENGLLDTWKRWNGAVSGEEMRGLTEIGLTKQIDEIAATAATPREIRERIAKLKTELQNRASSAVDNPIGVNRERKGFEFMDDIGKAEKEGLLDVDGTNRLNIMIEQSERASDELMRAIGKARDTVVDPAMREQFSVMEEAFSSVRRGAARQTSQITTQTAWALTKRARKSTGLGAEKLWNESILAKQGPPPQGLTPQQFMDELWQATRNEVSNTWEMYFADGFDRLTPLIDSLTDEFPEMQSLFSRSQKASAELNMYRTAVYRDGKIFYSQPPASVTELASRYGVSSATEAGVPKDKQLLASINKYADQAYKTLQEAEQDLPGVERALQQRAAAKGIEVRQAKSAEKSVTMEEAAQIPRGELPPEISARFEQEANRLMDELNSGTGPQVVQPRQGEPGVTKNIPSTNVDWYRDLPRNLQNKKTLNAALEKIIKDKGSDKGINVERVKELIIERFRYGDPNAGTPPDLKVLQGLGADKNTLQTALGDYNEITKQELALDDVLGGAQTEGAALTPDLSRPYYYDAGNLIEPKNPEVQIHPPYVDGSTPLPGQMWKESADGVLAALNKIERHMLDNYGLKAVEKFDSGQLKALKGVMKDAAGRITEGMAIADKIGREWRDFALLPYGETRNLDLALSYSFPYQFWYSRSYANWMKRVATDPQVIANYARIKESMSRVNKDSPEWWRYNVEIPSHFLGLPNEHPMSFNLEANIWPLYGLTGTDFNDPQKRTNWLTSTVDDIGKFGPSVWSPVQWAIALAFRAQGEEELAQAWAGRVIPQTATVKAISSYFGKPLELDPAVQLFSGKGLMDFEAMDKYERNRVGRAIAAMVQSGELTEEQAVEVARLQEGAAWDEAVQRATQIRAPGQIASYFLGVGMKARTEQDRQTDQFYEAYYRLQNLNEADLISPESYQQGWDALREQYPFMDALLLSRKAGPDRDRAYLYNVLGRIPPGQTRELYELVDIDPKLAQKFYDSKGNIKGLSESDRERLMAAGVDLGAMLSIPEYTTKQDWNEARNAYKDTQEAMKVWFGEDVQDQIDHFFSIADKNQQDAFAAANPKVQLALDWQNQQIVNNPSVYEFYGGLSVLERYHKGKVYDQLDAEFGAEIAKTWDQYYEMQMYDPKGARKFKRAHSELDAYSARKRVLMDEALRNIVEFATILPEADSPPELTGTAPASVGQQNIFDYANQPAAPTFEEWSAQLPTETKLIAEYWSGGIKLPSSVRNSLDFKAGDYGYASGEDLLEAILISLNK